MRGIGAGLGAVVLGGVVYAQLITALRGVGSLLLAGLLGYAIGRAVRWGTRGQSQQPFAGIAIGLAVVAVALGFFLRFATPLPPNVLPLAYPIAGWLALRGLQG